MKSLIKICLILPAIVFMHCITYAGNSGQKKFTSEKLIEDLNYLFDNLESIHPDLYYFTHQSNIDSLKLEVLKELDKPITRLDFARKVIPLVVALGDGHTSLRFPSEERNDYLDKDGGIFPFDVMIRENSLLIASNWSDDESIEVFSEILSINGVSSEKILETMRQYISAELDHFRDVRIERAFRFYLWAIFGFEDDYVLKLKDDGNMKTAEVTGITREELRAFQQMDEEPKPYSFYTLEDNEIGVIDFQRMIDPGKFGLFLDSVFTVINDKDIQHLIVDIRQNGGGSSLLANMLCDYITDNPYKMTTQMDIKLSKKTKQQYRQHFRNQIKWYKRPLFYIMSPFRNDLRMIFFSKPGTIVTYEQTDKTEPKDIELKFTGDTYLLTSHFTFSSANMLAAAFKEYEMGMIFGEETGGVLKAFGDIIHFQLPNTKLSAYCSHKTFVHPGYDGEVRGVIPDIKIKPSTEDIINERDVVIEYIIDLI